MLKSLLTPAQKTGLPSLLATTTSSLRATHTRSRTSKQNFDRRQVSEAVPNIYRFQKVVDPKMFFEWKIGHGHGKDRKRNQQRQARYWKALHEDRPRKELSGDMGMYTDNVRDKHRTDW